MPDIEKPSRAEYEAALGSDFDTSVPETATPEPAQVEAPESGAPATETQESAQPEAGAPTTPQPPAEQEGWKPDGPGDLRVAIWQEREARRQAESEAAQYRQLLGNPDLLRQLVAPQQAQEPQQQAPNPLEALAQADVVSDPEGFQQAALQAINYVVGQNQRLQATMHQNTALSRFEMARESARQKYPDYEQVVRRLEPLEGVLNPEVFSTDRGPELAYQLGRMLAAQQAPAPSQEAQQAQVDAAVSQVAQKLIPVPPTAPPRLGNLPSAAPNNDQRQTLADLSHRDIEKMGRSNWHKAALAGG
ncbi:MAG: hypothetical protein FJZ00_01455 [Candidatus Sericytochromatia bacterium]|uniref:Uncharacterized protein n=1 Tax=Candidatus Tanganyikabacteria bacterium TaxID=2961651 RepID=A0A937X0M8_9BACT|nr:hypothetical protein [Candidatus Tanganyikabacteria bacterium]